MSHHVAVTLPDGRTAMADYRQPVVNIMRRYLARTDKRLSGKDTASDDAWDLAVITGWLDLHPEQACGDDHCVLHGPASSEPFTPPPYRAPGGG